MAKSKNHALDYTSPLSNHDEEQCEFLREILRWRNLHRGRIPTLLDGYWIAMGMGYRLQRWSSAQVCGISEVEEKGN